MTNVFDINFIKENEILFYSYVIIMISIILITILLVIKETRK